MATSPKPVLNAMLICDKVIKEAGTNKKSLIGIFENISAHNFPCIHHFLAVYIKLTDANGRYKFNLELVDLETNASLANADIPEEIEINDPLRTHELVFNMGGLKFEHPGKYEFRIAANGDVFGQKTFVVTKAEDEPK